MKKSEKTEHLSCLVGKQLSAVQFVQDYLELHFDGQGLTCYVWPEVERDNRNYKFGDLDYRKKLCEMISAIVRSVSITENELLTISFEGESRIRLSLDPKNPAIVAEIAIFTDENGNISVFE